MNHEDPAEKAIDLLERIRHWPDAMFTQLDAADHHAIVTMLDLLDELPILLTLPLADLTAPQRDTLDRVVSQLEEYVQRFDHVLPAKPDAGSVQGHLEVSLDDLDAARSPSAVSRSWSYAYVHNTLLNCREKLWNALHDRPEPDQAPTDRHAAGKKPGEGEQ